MGRAALHRARQFQKPAIVQRYEEVYRSVIGSSVGEASPPPQPTDPSRLQCIS
jgi:hypothetical protein